MVIKQDVLEDYKNAIRLKYETEKKMSYSSFLIVPSRAKLRQLCVERLKDNYNEDDLKSFNLFFGFEFGIGTMNKLQTQTDKFRPIETFLKGETDLTDIEGINIAAILVDFNPRPFNKFSKKNHPQTESNSNNEDQREIKQVQETDFRSSGLAIKNGFNLSTIQNLKKTGVLVLSVLGVFSIGYTAKTLTHSEKQCMQWQNDHYVEIDCNNQQNSFAKFSPIIAKDENIKTLRKIDPCTVSDFFDSYGNSKVWYHKKNNRYEYFNSDGHHPITGKDLKPVTKYIIKNQINKNCK